MIAGEGSGQARSSSGPREVRRGVRRRGCCRAGGCFGAGGEDALDGAVGRVADGQGPVAGRFQPGGPDPGPSGETDDALRGPEPVQGVDLHQIVDHRGGRRADFLRLLPAPGRGPHVERDLLRRVVLEVGGPAPQQLDVGGDDLALVQDLHGVPRGPGINLLPDQPPRHRVEGLADFEVAVRADTPGRPCCYHEVIVG